ncbi:MAG: DUF2927 domain-containing protein [Magnetospirillum sp. WYHS-4]
MIRRLLSVFLLVFMAGAAQADPAGGKPGVDEILRYFDTIVFGAEVDKSLAAKVVAKWPTDREISVGLRGRYTDDHVRMFVKHLREIANLTRLKFDVFGGAAQKDRQADIDLVFVKRDEMDKIQLPNVDPALVGRMAASGGCYFLSFRKPPETFVKAVIVANVERNPDHLDACLLEEFTQALGLPNDSDDLRPSVFSDKDRLRALSRPDRILLRTLYDPRLPAGTPRARALEMARPIVAELDLQMPLDSPGR